MGVVKEKRQTRGVCRLSSYVPVPPLIAHSPLTENNTVEHPAAPEPKATTRYYGRVELDSQRVNREMGLIVEEVIERLTSIVGCEVEISVEINAKLPKGFDESTIRTVSENSRTLKFGHYGFEEG